MGNVGGFLIMVEDQHGSGYRPSSFRATRYHPSIEYRTGPSRIERYDLYPAAAVDGDTAPGFTLPPGAFAMAEVADRVLPDGFGFEWTALLYQKS